MSSRPEDLLEQASRLSQEVTAPLPGSRKIYEEGPRPDLRVGLREVRQSGDDTLPSIPVYDTSGPYTDPDEAVDIRAGLAPLREGWIRRREDTELLDGPSSDYVKSRSTDPALKDLWAIGTRAPRCARGSIAVTQMAYARAGIVTDEMEYVAMIGTPCCRAGSRTRIRCWCHR